MKQKLLSHTVAAKFPAIYATDDTPEESRPVVAKFFDPCGAGTWYAIEADALVAGRGEEGEWIPLADAAKEGRAIADVKFFGLCYIEEPELGYFLLSELATYRGPLGIGIERDLYFKGSLADARKELDGRMH